MIIENKTIDVTSLKTSKITRLKNQVDDQKVIVSEATSKYNSFVTKNSMYQTLLSQATQKKTVAISNEELLLTALNHIENLSETAEQSSEVAQTTFFDAKKILSAWEDVVETTIDAANKIYRATDYINRRKASNDLISNDLVSEAVTANALASKIVADVIDALVAATEALTGSDQSSKSTALVELYISLLQNAIEGEKDGKKGSGIEKTQRPNLKDFLKTDLKVAKKNENDMQRAANNAAKAMAVAKEEMNQAIANLSALNNALSAAEAAVLS